MARPLIVVADFCEKRAHSVKLAISGLAMLALVGNAENQLANNIVAQHSVKRARKWPRAKLVCSLIRLDSFPLSSD